MKRTLACLAAILSLATGCATARFPGGTRGDSDAVYAQELMEQTVQIRTKILAETTLKDEDGKEQTIRQELGWSGSGVVVDVDDSKGNGQSLILTAAHVSHVGETVETPILFFTITWKVLEVQQQVVTLDGKVCEAKPLVEDEEIDDAVMVADCIAGKPARLAKELPPVGAIITDVGAPLGFHPKMVFGVTDGRYLGLTDGFTPMMSTNVPGAPGCSGSGYFYKGEVVGILTRGAGRYPNLTLGVELKHLKKIVRMAEELWNE